jgi:hypothetical protein
MTWADAATLDYLACTAYATPKSLSAAQALPLALAIHPAISSMPHGKLAQWHVHAMQPEAIASFS